MPPAWHPPKIILLGQREATPSHPPTAFASDNPHKPKNLSRDPSLPQGSCLGMGGCGPAARHHPPPRSSSCRNTWRFFWDEFGGLLLPAAFLGRQPGSPYKTAFLKGLLGGGSSTTPQNCSPEEGRKQSANAHGFQGRKWARGWCEEQGNGGGSECKVGMRTLIPYPETPMHTSSSMPLSEQLHAFSGSLQSMGLSKLRNWGQTLGNWGQQPRNWDGNPRTGMETPGIGVGMQELN